MHILYMAELYITCTYTYIYYISYIRTYATTLIAFQATLLSLTEWLQ